MTLPTTPARRPLAASILASAILASAFLAGSAAAAAGQDGGTGATGGITSPRVAEDVQRALDAYLVGPGAAAELGCSIAWQADAIVPPGHRLRLVSASPEGVLALNTRNEVTLIRVATGDRAWSATAAQAIDRVLAMDLVTEERDRAFRDDLTIITDTQYFRLDPENGAAVGKERLRQLPVAPPVAYEGRIIYGARSGEAVWLNAATGYLLKASAIDPAAESKTSIATTPAIGEGAVVMGSLKGTVVCFDARSGQPSWRRDDLLGGVTATPAIGGDAVYVASDDQYLYAFDLGDGSTNWKYFTQSPLRTSPFLGHGLVLQEVPGEGCVALAMDAEGQLDGAVRWRRAGIPGAPIAAIAEGRSGSFLFWCPKGRVATVVDARNGDVVRSIALPAVEQLAAGSIEEGGFVAWNADGRIQRLSPLPRAASSAPAKGDGGGDAGGQSGDGGASDSSESSDASEG